MKLESTAKIASHSTSKSAKANSRPNSSLSQRLKSEQRIIETGSCSAAGWYWNTVSVNAKTSQAPGSNLINHWFERGRLRSILLFAFSGGSKKGCSSQTLFTTLFSMGRSHLTTRIFTCVRIESKSRTSISLKLRASINDENTTYMPNAVNGIQSFSKCLSNCQSYSVSFFLISIKWKPIPLSSSLSVVWKTSIK